MGNTQRFERGDIIYDSLNNREYSVNFSSLDRDIVTYHVTSLDTNSSFWIVDSVFLEPKPKDDNTLPKSVSIDVYTYVLSDSYGNVWCTVVSDLYTAVTVSGINLGSGVSVREVTAYTLNDLAKELSLSFFSGKTTLKLRIEDSLKVEVV